MKIQFNEITAGGLHLRITDQSWFPAQELRGCGPVRAELDLERRGEKLVLMAGVIEGEVLHDCDRCLKPYKSPLAGSFKVDLELMPAAGRFPGEYQCGPDEMDTIYLREPEIDIFQVLSQQVLLNLPLKRLCAEDCRGICPGCGADLNLADCRCRGGAGVSPFSILAGLKVEEEK